MNFKIIFSLALLLMISTTTFAGFPVERVAKTTTEVNAASEASNELVSPAAVAADRQTVAILLWLFLGAFAAHRWYLGSPILWNIVFILTAGFFVVGWVIDGIEIITGTYPGL
ncbi:TM2 domain-containing protein [Leeuwenhoekiella polynyae]|uniref:TM2 domain-containing protein n=1 Tax=Leeuwenhoekiella polynyae TaxID=1550906 RepID=A0A4V1KQ96_9FLAO|nr:TM2 domain-containing protein [Leeuwenhoekiella polynyae]RXG20642.1 TM2 domain-containing protein [Leeuwenhoekiella polynyae]|tara:strand:- start:125 stop:463 length:339 start_codon:yes stop_codon:yes gene_type:complete